MQKDTLLVNNAGTHSITGTVTLGDGTVIENTLEVVIDPSPSQETKHPFYYLKDHLGSTRAVIDAAGNVTESSDYYPFGLQMPGRGFLQGSIATKEGFTGKEQDGETGWHYHGARFRHPAFGPWLSVDPLMDEFPSHSPYNYTLGNPVIFFDPDGQRPWRSVEKKVVLKGLRSAEIQYFTELGKDWARVDKGMYSTSGHLDFEEPVEVKGLKQYGDMQGAEKSEVTSIIRNEYLKFGFGDPRANVITGIEEENGPEIIYLIGKTPKENTINTLRIIHKKGASVVRLQYMGVNEAGREIKVAYKIMTLNQYEEWLEEMKKVTEDVRKKENEDEEENP